MPNNGKKGGKKNSLYVSDVKLADFADASVPARRLKKSVKTFFSKEVVEETLWFEKNIEDFELLSINGQNPGFSKERTNSTSEESPNSPGIRYPLDLWYLLSLYIKPEEVKVFACICRDSYFVSRSYIFWLKMYKRYYTPSIHLPPRLQPDCIEQAFCLKTSVVRALYQMYPDFINQVSKKAWDSDVYCLANLCCTLMWRSQQNGKWTFHFKFQTPTSAANDRITYRGAIKRMWTSNDAEDNKDMYVNLNPEEGCKILRFVCSHFVVVPPVVMGSRLSDVHINLAHDMRRQKLKLIFCHSNYRQTKNCSNNYKENIGYSDVVEFDAVENLVVLNWWHPQYPLDQIVQ